MRVVVHRGERVLAELAEAKDRTDHVTVKSDDIWGVMPRSLVVNGTSSAIKRKAEACNLNNSSEKSPKKLKEVAMPEEEEKTPPCFKKGTTDYYSYKMTRDARKEAAAHAAAAAVREERRVQDSANLETSINSIEFYINILIIHT